MECEIIATGSAGNAVLLDGRLLIDCGVPFKALCPVDGVELVLLTHEHGDHFKPSTVRRLSKEIPGLRFAGGAWMARRLLEAGVPARRVDILDAGAEYAYQGLCRVEPVSLDHDVPNCGYKLRMSSGERVFYATDTASLHGIRAEQYDLYLLEANYDEDEIAMRIQDHKANGEYAYERRVLKTHLSRQQADNWLCANMGPTSKVIYMHEHRERKNANGQSGGGFREDGYGTGEAREAEAEMLSLW